jgi:hypothetical protein
MSLRTRVEAGTPPGLNARAASWAIGTVGVVLVVVFLVCLAPVLRHWMILPVTVCGVLVAPDVVDWARKRLDVFDPQAVVALMGLHFFFLAPILHVLLDYWPRYEPPVDDWPAALGRMAALNIVGLLGYRAVLARPDPRVRLSLRRVERGPLLLTGALALLVGLIVFVAFIAQFGGLAGYVDYMTSTDRDLAGYGLTVAVSSSFPFVAFLLALVLWPAALRRRPWLLVLLLLAFVVVQLLVGGLRGSRAGVIWPLLIAIGMCHLLIVPIRRRVLLGSLIAILGFMYVYGFYKSVGREAVDIFTGARTVDELSSETGRDLPVLLLGDLGRADIQALVLERVRADTAPVAFGGTYVGDVASLLPGDLDLGFPDKVRIGTDMLYGPGTYDAGMRSSRIYGLAGEAMLNFGAVGAVAVFLPFGWLVRWSRACHRRARAPDGSIGLRVLAPVMPIALVVTLTADLDNVAWFVANQVAVVAAVVLLSRRSGVDLERASG